MGTAIVYEYAAAVQKDGADDGSDSPSVQMPTPDSSSSSNSSSSSSSSRRQYSPAAHEKGGDKSRSNYENMEEEDDVELRYLGRQRGRSTRHRRRLAYTAEEERAVVRKFDRRLVLFVALLYMMSFLDRSNIGNARAAGMEDDLQTTPPRADWYEWALSAFYVTYIGCEWMALLWQKLPAHAFVASLVAAWGLAAALQAVAISYPALIFLRALLGIGEAGFAGIPLYLARFFRRDELAFRTAIFLAAAPLATSFAASLAWLIVTLARRFESPIAAWRLLFLIEGFPSVLAAVAAWRVLPDAPERARYLTRRQRRIARERLGGEEEAAAAGGEEDEEDGKQSAGSPLAALLDPVAWTSAAMFFLANMAYSSLPVFLPTILADMGHVGSAAQALAAPPYLVAFVSVLVTAYWSDRMRARGPLLVAHALASAAGYSMLALSEHTLGRTSPWRYWAVFPAAAGFFSVVVLLICWNLNNQRGARRQGAAFALFQAVGQCGPLVGTRLYPDTDAPLFLRGMRTMAMAMFCVALLALFLRLLLRRRNRRLDARAAAEGPVQIQLHDEEADADGASAGERHDSYEADGLVDGVRRLRTDTFRYML